MGKEAYACGEYMAAGKSRASPSPQQLGCHCTASLAQRHCHCSHNCINRHVMQPGPVGACSQAVGGGGGEGRAEQPDGRRGPAVARLGVPGAADGTHTDGWGWWHAHGWLGRVGQCWAGLHANNTCNTHKCRSSLHVNTGITLHMDLCLGGRGRTQRAPPHMHLTTSCTSGDMFFM